MLGIDPPGEPGFGGYSPDIAWQKFNPYPKLQVRGIPDSWVFASNDASETGEALSATDPITSGLGEILFPVPGIIQAAADNDKNFTPLVRTGELSGMVRYQAYREAEQDPFRLAEAQGKPRGTPLILAARIQGKPIASGSSSADDTAKKDAESKGADAQGDKSKDGKSAGPSAESDKNAKEDGKKAKDGDDKSAAKDAGADKKKAIEKKPIDCVYVADIDLMSWQFLRIRARPGEDEDINWRFENVTFLLNIIDSLSGDNEYVDIRKRQIRHSTLRVVEETTRAARDEELEQQLDFADKVKQQDKERDDKQKESRKKAEDRLQELEKKKKDGEDFNIQDYVGIKTQLALLEARIEQEKQVAREKAERDRTENIEKIRRETDLRIQKIQNWFKFLAVVLPPIPPLVVGLVVFVSRRLREREGVSKARLR